MRIIKALQSPTNIIIISIIFSTIYRNCLPYLILILSNLILILSCLLISALLLHFLYYLKTEFNFRLKSEHSPNCSLLVLIPHHPMTTTDNKIYSPSLHLCI